MRILTRPVNGGNRYHPHVHVTPGGDGCVRQGWTVPLMQMYGPAGLVGPVGSTDHPYVGMDPSDPVTWVRAYNPQPGMVAYLNFDGAQVNPSQTGGPRKRWQK